MRVVVWCSSKAINYGYARKTPCLGRCVLLLAYLNSPEEFGFPKAVEIMLDQSGVVESQPLSP